jgi:hypothetical protein
VYIVANLIDISSDLIQDTAGSSLTGDNGATRKMRWKAYVARMGVKRIAYRILVEKPQGRPRRRWEDNNVTDLINAFPGNSSVNATIEEAVFSVDPTDAPIDWLDTDHVICVYCRSMSVPRLYK